MSTNHHTPHAYGAALTSAELNSPLGELDSAISGVITTGSGASTSLTAQAAAGQATLTVASSTGFAIGDAIFIGVAGGTHESRVVNTVPNGTTITVTVNLSNTYASGSPVSKSPVEIVDARGVYTDLGGRVGAIEGRVYDVKKYGAKGDGTTDDRAAIRAAIDAAGAGSVIFFPAGTYLCNTAVGSITKRLHFIGQGATLKAGANNLNDWAIAIGDGITSLAGISIRGLTFDSASRARQMVHVNLATDVLIADCVFTGYSYTYGYYATDSALMFDAVTRGRVSNCVFRDLTYGNNGAANLHRAISVQGVSADISVIGCNFENADQGIIIADSIVRFAVLGCSFDHLSDNGFYILTGTGLTIVGNILNDCEEAIVVSASTGVMIGSNRFSNWTNKAVTLKGASTDVTISGNVFLKGENCIGRSAGGDSITGLAVVGNSFYGTVTFACVYLDIATDVLVVGNRFRIASATAQHFMRFDGVTTNVLIASNTFDSSTGAAGSRIRFNNATNTNAVISNNLFSGGAYFDRAPGVGVVFRGQDYSNASAGGTPTKTIVSGAAAPTGGTWNQGDIVFNTAPAASGTIGWVCTTGGTPGTWKTFGAISA